MMMSPDVTIIINVINAVFHSVYSGKTTTVARLQTTHPIASKPPVPFYTEDRTERLIPETNTAVCGTTV